jgi:hypothetical protein
VTAWGKNWPMPVLENESFITQPGIFRMRQDVILTVESCVWWDRITQVFVAVFGDGRQQHLDKRIPEWGVGGKINPVLNKTMNNMAMAC